MHPLMSTLGQNSSTCFQENAFQVLKLSEWGWRVLRCPQTSYANAKIPLSLASHLFSLLYLFVTQIHFTRKK